MDECNWNITLYEGDNEIGSFITGSGNLKAILKSLVHEDFQILDIVVTTSDIKVKFEKLSDAQIYLTKAKVAFENIELNMTWSKIYDLGNVYMKKGDTFEFTFKLDWWTQ